MYYIEDGFVTPFTLGTTVNWGGGVITIGGRTTRNGIFQTTTPPIVTTSGGSVIGSDITSMLPWLIVAALLVVWLAK